MEPPKNSCPTKIRKKRQLTLSMMLQPVERWLGSFKTHCLQADNENGMFQQDNSPCGWPAPHVCVWCQVMTRWALKQMKLMWSAGQRGPEPTSVHLQDTYRSPIIRCVISPVTGTLLWWRQNERVCFFLLFGRNRCTTVSSNRESGFSGSTAPPPGWCGCSAPVEIRQRGGKINTPEWISYINCTEILPSVTYRLSI